MSFNFDFVTVQVVLAFMLCMARTLAVIMLAPILSREQIPAVVKVGFAACICFGMFDQILSYADRIIPSNPWLYTILIASESLIGAMIGFLFNVVFDAIVTLAQIAGVQMGMSSSNVFNPATRAGINPIASLYQYLSLIIFIYLHGFYNMFYFLRFSFEIFPIASYHVNLIELFSRSIPLINNIFIASLKLIFPLVAIMFVVDVFAALVAKILPQANMYFLVMPNKLFLGLIVISLTLSGYISTMDTFFSEIIIDLFAELFY